MEKKNLFLIQKNDKYLVKEGSGSIYILDDFDIKWLNMKDTSFTDFGICEEDGETLYSLKFLQLPESEAGFNPGHMFNWLTKDELFRSGLRAGDRLFLAQMVEGRKNINLVVRYNGDKLVTAYDRRKVPFLKAFFKHLHTVNRHRRLVRHYCFKVGLIWQGIIHDLSKYSPAEFLVGVKFYQGTRSPNVAERNSIGYSTAWMHHKGRNKHHHEYWTDYSVDTGNTLEFMEMPPRYFVESIMDRIAASRVYRGASYNDSAALDYMLTRDSESHMNKKNHDDMIDILTMLSKEGEARTFKYIKKEILHRK